MEHAFTRLWRVATVALVLGLAPRAAAGQTVEALFGQIEAAIRTGDAAALSTHFNASVEVTIADKGQDYSRNQAQFVVKEFFAANPVKTFGFAHRGNSGTTYYAVGSYATAKGTYDVNVFVKKYPEGYRIDQIRFEREN